MAKRKTGKKKGFALIYAVVLFLVIVGGAALLVVPFVKNGASHAKALGARESTVAAAVVTPKPSPSPSVKPTVAPSASASAAPVVYSGFCLNVPVIFYHHVQPLSEAKEQNHAQLTVDNGIFDTQMAYLVSRGYTAVSAEQLGNALLSKTKLPGKPIVISFDDAYADFYKYGYPIMQKYHLISSLAVPTGLLENGSYFNWGQLKEMVGSGQVFAYNHTWSHYNIGAASVEKAQSEVSTAKAQLQENLGKSSSVFFYPYGGIGNTKVLYNNGYNVAFSTIGGTMQCDSFLMSLHRTRIGNSPLASYGI